MIPPSLLNISYYFSLLPIYEQAPAEPAAPCPPPASDAGDANADTPAPETNVQPGGDADGINDQVALRMVFKGYKLTAIPQWEAQANAGYERWIESGGDDDAERQRQDQRARGTVKPQPPVAGGPAPSTPAAAAD